MQLLQDVFIIENLQVISESSSKKMKIRGVFGRCNEKNNNGRIYPTKVLESQLNQIIPLIKERRLCGELDHPQNETVKLSNASHLITKLEFKGNDLIGEAEILDTPAGLTAKALINGGVKIGISSRGMGTLSEDNDGNKIVNEDYRLVTFDLVSDPSTRGAFPGLSESTQYQYATKTKEKLAREQVFVTLLENKFNKEFVDEGSLGMRKTMRREKAFVNSAIKGDRVKQNRLGKKLDKANAKKDKRRKDKAMENGRTNKSIADHEARQDWERMRIKEAYLPIAQRFLSMLVEEEDDDSGDSLYKTVGNARKREGAFSRILRHRAEVKHAERLGVAKAKGEGKGGVIRAKFGTKAAKIKAKGEGKANIIKAKMAGKSDIVKAKMQNKSMKVAGVGAAKASAAVDKEALKQKGNVNKAKRRLYKYGSTTKAGIAANLAKQGVKAGAKLGAKGASATGKAVKAGFGALSSRLAKIKAARAAKKSAPVAAQAQPQAQTQAPAQAVAKVAAKKAAVKKVPAKKVATKQAPAAKVPAKKLATKRSPVKNQAPKGKDNSANAKLAKFKADLAARKAALAKKKGNKYV